MGLGIIFCITEVQILQDVQARILEGTKADQRIATLLSLFPPNYCAFEVIVLLRIAFFCCFNIVNGYSTVFVVDDTKLRLYKAAQTELKEQQIT